MAMTRNGDDMGDDVTSVCIGMDRSRIFCCAAPCRAALGLCIAAQCCAIQRRSKGAANFPNCCAYDPKVACILHIYTLTSSSQGEIHMELPLMQALHNTCQPTRNVFVMHRALHNPCHTFLVALCRILLDFYYETF